MLTTLMAVYLTAAPVGIAAAPAEGKQSAECLACIKACTDCQAACDACYLHCSRNVIAGDKGKATSMETCLGCADACKLTATLTLRQSPVAAHSWECCMRCCGDAATACEKYPDDKAMAACAEACRTCESACKSMVMKK